MLTKERKQHGFKLFSQCSTSFRHWIGNGRVDVQNALTAGHRGMQYCRAGIAKTKRPPSNASEQVDCGSRDSYLYVYTNTSIHGGSDLCTISISLCDPHCIVGFDIEDRCRSGPIIRFWLSDAPCVLQAGPHSQTMAGLSPFLFFRAEEKQRRPASLKCEDRDRGWPLRS